MYNIKYLVALIILLQYPFCSLAAERGKVILEYEFDGIEASLSMTEIVFTGSTPPAKVGVNVNFSCSEDKISASASSPEINEAFNIVDDPKTVSEIEINGVPLISIAMLADEGTVWYHTSTDGNLNLAANKKEKFFDAIKAIHRDRNIKVKFYPPVEGVTDAFTPASSFKPLEYKFSEFYDGELENESELKHEVGHFYQTCSIWWK